MIKLWIHRRAISHYSPHGLSDIISNDGIVNLTNLTWYDRLVYYPSDVEIGMDFLNKGFAI